MGAAAGNNEAMDGDLAQDEAFERVGDGVCRQLGGGAEQIFRPRATPLQKEMMNKVLAELLAPCALGWLLGEEGETQNLRQQGFDHPPLCRPTSSSIVSLLTLCIMPDKPVNEHVSGAGVEPENLFRLGAGRNHRKVRNAS